MDWIPAPVLEGGPWAILLTVLFAISFLFWRGVFVSGPQVDRTIAGYINSTAVLEKELAFWRSSSLAKDGIIERQAEQLQKMMTYTALGTHALVEIQREAEKR